MANFYVRTSAQIIPIEEIAFTDSTQKAKGIHSTLDRTFSITREKLIGTTATDIQKWEFTFGAGEFTVETTFRDLTGITDNLKFLYAVFTLDTDEEGAYIKVGDSTITAQYIGSFGAGWVGAFVLLDDCDLDTSKIFIGTSGAYSAKALTFLIAI